MFKTVKLKSIFLVEMSFNSMLYPRRKKKNAWFEIYSVFCIIMF